MRAALGGPRTQLVNLQKYSEKNVRFLGHPTADIMLIAQAETALSLIPPITMTLAFRDHLARHGPRSSCVSTPGKTLTFYIKETSSSRPA